MKERRSCSGTQANTEEGGIKNNTHIKEIDRKKKDAGLNFYIESFNTQDFSISTKKYREEEVYCVVSSPYFCISNLYIPISYFCSSVCLSVCGRCCCCWKPCINLISSCIRFLLYISLENSRPDSKAYNTHPYTASSL